MNNLIYAFLPFVTTAIVLIIGVGGKKLKKVCASIKLNTNKIAKT